MVKYEELQVNLLEEYRLNGGLKDKYVLNLKGKLIFIGIVIIFGIIILMKVM